MSGVQEMKRKAPQQTDAAKKQRQDAAAEKRSSKYVGVSWHISKAKYGVYGKWKVQISHEGVQRTLDYFPSDKEKEAAECYDKEARKLHGAKAKLNFPKAGEVKGAALKRRTAEQVAADRALGGMRKSKYVGVSWCGVYGKWQVAISHEGVQRTLGAFPYEQEKEAAECYDAEARRLRGADSGWLKLNFPLAGEMQGAPKARRAAEQVAAGNDK